MGAAQGNVQQGAVNHRGFIDQHQAQVLQGHGGLLGFLTALEIALAFELEPQQPVDGGGKPGGLQLGHRQMTPQHPHGLMGWCHHGPTQPRRLGLS